MLLHDVPVDGAHEALRRVTHHPRHRQAPLTKPTSAVPTANPTVAPTANRTDATTANPTAATTAKPSAATMLALLLPPSPCVLLWLHLFRVEIVGFAESTVGDKDRHFTITCEVFAYMIGFAIAWQRTLGMHAVWFGRSHITRILTHNYSSTLCTIKRNYLRLRSLRLCSPY